MLSLQPELSDSQDSSAVGDEIGSRFFYSGKEEDAVFAGNDVGINLLPFLYCGPEHSGITLRRLYDVDGDAIDDVAIGAPDETNADGLRSISGKRRNPETSQ